MSTEEPPDDTEAAACMVARDAVEEGKLDLARKILDEQAPRRLDARCPACRAAEGAPCQAMASVECDACAGTGATRVRVILGPTETVAPMQCHRCRGAGRRDEVVDLLVPHEARLVGR